MQLDVEGLDEAYASIRSDTQDPNWLLLDYASNTGNKLVLSKTGTGGLPELVAEFDDTKAQYGYVRVEYANDAESKRVKFALIVWIGESTGVMRKARVSIESGSVKAGLNHHISVEARDRHDVAEKEIVSRMRKAGGADYNGGRG